MNNIVVSSTVGITLILSLVYLIYKGFSLIKVHLLNLARLDKLKKRYKDPKIFPKDKEAIITIINVCEYLRTKWVLDESDLRILQNTRNLATDIAKAFHPNAPVPLAEARLGQLLKAFLDLKNQMAGLAKLKGIQNLTQFRLKHVLFLSKAWRKKQEWELSATGSFFKKFRIFLLTKWLYFLIRSMDLSFWAMRMLRYFVYDVTFKVLLAHWYLVVGELAMTVYRERDERSNIQKEKIFEEFGTMPDPDDLKVTGLPEGIQSIVDASRKNILFNPWVLEWQKTRDICIQLVADIALFYHPHAEQPIYELKIFKLLKASARFAETISFLQTYPFVNKALDLRVSHLIWIKDAAEVFQDNQLLAWLKNYQIHKVVKYSSLIFKTIKTKHPSLIFKDFAFSLAKEGSKRWFYLYCHEKIAIESNESYREE